MARNSVNLTSAFTNQLQRWDFKMEKTQNDLVKVLEEFKPTMRDRIKIAKQQFRAIKLTFIVTVEYRSKKYLTNEPFYMYLRTSMMLIYQDSEIEQAIADMYKEIMTRNENAIRNESNLEIVNIFYITIMLSRFEPLTASHFRHLPKFLEKNRVIVNIQNRDQNVLLKQFYPLCILQRSIQRDQSNI